MRVEYEPNSGEQMVEHEAEVRAKDIRANLHQDMHTTAASEGLTDMPHLLDSLVDDAMFQIEHLLVEIEALHMKDRARDSRSTE